MTFPVAKVDCGGRTLDMVLGFEILNRLSVGDSDSLAPAREVMAWRGATRWGCGLRSGAWFKPQRVGSCQTPASPHLPAWAFHGTRTPSHPPLCPQVSTAAASPWPVSLAEEGKGGSSSPTWPQGRLVPGSGLGATSTMEKQFSAGVPRSPSGVPRALGKVRAVLTPQLREEGLLLALKQIKKQGSKRLDQWSHRLKADTLTAEKEGPSLRHQAAPTPVCGGCVCVCVSLTHTLTHSLVTADLLPVPMVRRHRHLPV